MPEQKLPPDLIAKSAEQEALQRQLPDTRVKNIEMLTVLAIAALLQPSAPRVQQSLAAFSKAARTIEDDWTKDQVRRLLGPPGKIDPSEKGYEDWLYGCKGRSQFPTLGQVEFLKGKVLFVHSCRTPPPNDLISEKELNQALAALYWPELTLGRWLGLPRDADDDSLRLVQAANLLIGKGPLKALAILKAYAQLSGEEKWLFWLARVAFTPDEPHGVFPIPYIGLMDPRPPQSLATWPTYPILFEDDIPVCVEAGELLRGTPESFDQYMERCSSKWMLRKQRLHPPDDPFDSFQRLAATPLWPYPKLQVNGAYVPSWPGEYGLYNLLMLVRTAYSPPSVRSGRPRPFEEYHREYQALGCHWSDAKQCYVRRDGTTLPGSDPWQPQ